MNRFTKSLLTGVLLALPLLGQAHAGHGVHEGHEAAHFLGSPMHIIPLAVLLTLAVVVLFLFARQWWKLREERAE